MEKAGKTLAEVASTREMLGQMHVPERLEEIRKVVTRPAPRVMNYAEAAAKQDGGRRREPGPFTRPGTGHTSSWLPNSRTTPQSMLLRNFAVWWMPEMGVAVDR
ncbi:hypothetical protein EVAR_90505_1 [Eumeta japonica]|uniref:Uncharacterized protein n=1 Tax=Eumeta variegata TaxID=151549 RepID=A0A4C2A8I4_EUMVA|nr:hypothetical protein EVAR_90505_1 [Eumeta japonica]